MTENSKTFEGHEHPDPRSAKNYKEHPCKHDDTHAHYNKIVTIQGQREL